MHWWVGLLTSKQKLWKLEAQAGQDEEEQHCGCCWKAKEVMQKEADPDVDGAGEEALARAKLEP